MSRDIQPTGEVRPAQVEQPKKKSAFRSGLEWLLKVAVLRGLGKLWDLIF